MGYVQTAHRDRPAAGERLCTRGERRQAAWRTGLRRGSRRALVYIDIENLLGPHRRCSSQCWYGHVGTILGELTIDRDDVHSVIASGPACAAAAGFAVPGARLLIGRGVDGADRRIIDDIDADWISERYTDVVIASGDHIFTESVEALRDRGLAVGVVGVRAHTSHVLSKSADWTRLVSYPRWCDQVSDQGRSASLLPDVGTTIGEAS